VLYISVVIFVITASAGMTMLVLRLRRGKNPPAVLAIVHGIFAACGLVVLTIAPAVAGLSVKAVIATVLYEFAGMAGFGAASFHLRGKLLPVYLAAVHASIAVTATVLLVLGIMAH